MKVIAVFGVIVAFAVVIDCRHVHHNKKHHKGSNFAKKTLIQNAHKKEIAPGCCGQTTIDSIDPFSCCQSPNPPQCCTNQSPSTTFLSQPNVPLHNLQPQQTSPIPQPHGSCCQNVSPPPGNCCESSHAPPCCSQVPHYMTIQGCCTTVPTPPDQYGCCHGPNPPPCCLNLRLKAGEERNISLSNCGKNYVLNVKLLHGANNCTEIKPTTNPPTNATSGPSSGPTKATSGPSSGSTKATSGPTKATSGPSSGSTKATSGPTKATSGPSSGPTTGSTKAPTSGLNDCQKKALQVHNIKRVIHNSPRMTLDPELNMAAQEYADKLAQLKLIKHSTNQERPGQGENLVKHCSSQDNGYDCGAAVNKWYNEVHDYDFGSPGFYPSTGHFTQVVWKGSIRLGIGKASYKDDAGKTCYVVVGRYQSAGNIRGEFQENVERGSYTGL